MRLKSLEILGFKSFADPFRIDFRKGISAIVGPNGCGKSNVADAIRWVLGTQSPRQLRTEKMESVIFSGSTKRKQVGMAEVTLTFDNSDRSLNLDYDEVSVSRRLFRSGESEYSINGSRCRLMDITDLVVDRGLGSTGYWILESKMVGRILSSRPEDRRFLFDEAAGIVKYKIQRHRAELKLESAASDLERLADIISEVESTCTGLKRQVSAFRKHERISDSIKSLREATALIESGEIRSQLKICTDNLDETGALVGRETAALAARSAVLAEAKTEYARVQGRLDEAHGTCAALDSRLAGIDRETAVTGEKIESSSARIAENNARTARERERAELYRRDIETLQGEKEALEPVTGELEKKHQSAEEEIRRLREELDSRRSKSGTIRSELSVLEEKIAGLQKRYLDGVRQDEARNQRLAWLETTAESIRERVSSRKTELSDLLEERIRIQEKIEDLGRSSGEYKIILDGLQEPSQELKRVKAALEREAAVLEDHLSRAEDALSKSISPESLSSLLIPLPGMGKALGAFLHGFNSAVPVERADLETQGNGALFVQLPGKPDFALPEGSRTLNECVENPGVNPVAEAVLRRGVIAPDRPTAMKWINEGCPVPVVTADGDLFRPEGFLRLGVAAEVAGSLELQQIIQDNREEILAKQQDHQKVVDELAAIEEKVNGIRESLSLVLDRSAAGERELAALNSTISSMESALELLRKELHDTESESEALKQVNSETSEVNYSREMEALQLERDKAAAAGDEIALEISGLEKLLSETVRSTDGIQFTLREKRNREKEIRDRTVMLESERDRIDDLLEELSQANAASASAMQSMGERLQQLEKETEALKKERGEAEELRNGFAVERNRLMESTVILEREVQQIRDRLGRAKSQMIEQESLARALNEKLAGMEETFSSGDNPYLDLSPEELAGRLDEENEKLLRIGPVNMLAVGEFEETSKRLQYLTEQKSDLEAARASLSRAIHEINEEAAGRFRETFDKVRENFREMFCKLFGGGEGDIFSVEGEDPLEGGIEIMARPLGKKLKNVIALSEGEKAMTAVALLFSLYLVKPSPFCVLDELDAPFDDSNIDKFTAILREFSTDTQFIVITHNKRTMEGSDVLYGITMAEEGVSCITSVNMEEMVKNS